MLELALAAGGFGVFNLNLVTGEISGTPLFFDFIGQPDRELCLTREEWMATIHPEDMEGVVLALGAAIDSGADYQCEYRILLLSGTVRWLANRGRVVKDSTGQPIRAIGTVSDITERKLLEERLQYATESLNIAQAAAGLATFDFNYGTTNRLCSDNFYTLLGLPASCRLDDLNELYLRVHPDDLDRMRLAPLGTSVADPSYRCEYRVLLDGGQERWIGEKATVSRDQAGNIVRVTGAIVDISDLKSAEQATLDAKLAAEAANRAKSSFLANVSHEIRTPMNGVMGMAQILGETTLDNGQRECVDIIRGSAQSLLALISDVLDLSKIEADRLELEHVDFALPDLIYEIVASMSLQSAVKGIELIFNIDSRAPTVVRGDPGRLRQIVMNLIGNAVKFTHEGYVVLDVSGVIAADGRSMLQVEVTDTGIGIPPDRLDRLFKTFSQVDSSTTRHYGGTGLGLSIVKRLAELMGGEVGARSDLGKGSTFWVTLEVETVAQHLPRLPVGAGKRILIVDDVPVSGKSMARKLKLAEFETVVVTGVDEALAELASGRRVDLVLADELMPVKGGLDLLAALRGDLRHLTLPFIMMSLAGVDNQSADRRHQPDAVARKPARATSLCNLVHRVLCGTQLGNSHLLPALQTDPTFSGSRVLLVEDNPVNQRVAQRLLQKLGAEVTIANNGAEALERLAESTYDAMLMDCQMPVMDGFTATRRIREAEGRMPGSRRMPIIALTANVMIEDRESCIAAGMDAHLGKPIEPAKLIDCLGRYIKPGPAHAEVDMEKLHAVTGGDAEFERELVETFVTSGDQCLAEIVEALRVSDLITIGNRAHVLKGASANIHATDLAAAAANLEAAARANAGDQLGALVQELARRLQAVNAELRKAG
jgi:two-component system sensor histidine kinase/response regulator